MGICPELVGAQSPAHSALPYPPNPLASSVLQRPLICPAIILLSASDYQHPTGGDIIGKRKEVCRRNVDLTLLIYLELRDFFFSFLVCIKHLMRCKESVCPGWDVTVTVLVNSLSSQEQSFDAVS